MALSLVSAAAPALFQLPNLGAKASPKAPPAFAYGLPGNFNAVGGEGLNWDPAGFLEGKSEVEVNRYREVRRAARPPRAPPRAAHTHRPLTRCV